MSETDKTVDIRQRVLAENDRCASEIREMFARGKTLVINMISSPGSGKTTLLEATVAALRGELRLGAIEGDIATERDAERLRRLQIPAHQILTGGACHLDARQVRAALDTARFGELDMLFIENVGNLICPTSYDLGEDFKVALLSVTEGEDKPFKYPAIFSRAAVTVITKADLLAHLDFAMDEVQTQIRSLNPEGRIFVTSAKASPGIAEWTDFLKASLAAKRGG